MEAESGKTVEELFDRLGEVISEMEEDDVSLDESFKLYEEGMKLLKESNERIDTVEKKVLALTGDNDLKEFGDDENGF
ncbi:MAG: exodeoxyribonuclease VII small subunit [Lachnospiraceae bacterium]|nr:exodeoxyribonuclease VII small subunit [Lachnospiraceae bacterium]